MFDVLKWATRGEFRVANHKPEDFHKNWAEERGEPKTPLAISLRNRLIQIGDIAVTIAIGFGALTAGERLGEKLGEHSDFPAIPGVLTVVIIGTTAGILNRSIFGSIYRRLDIE